MGIFRAEICLVLIVCFQSFQNCRAASSRSFRPWNTWRDWVNHLRAPRIMREHSSVGKRSGVSFIRGGSSCDDTLEGEKYEQEADQIISSSPSDAPFEPDKKISLRIPYLVRKTHRCTQDIILDLLERSSIGGKQDSIELRELITTRASDYLEELRIAMEANGKGLTHPRKLLHFLAPKVPAIKHSPDVNLRIHSARSDIDASIAACIIGTLAHVSEVYDKQMFRKANSNEETHSVAPDLTTDRRFEQLVECVLNGVNIKKRKKQSLTRQLDRSSDGVADIEQVLDDENAHIDDGLNVRDACRAAWGISVLGCSHLETFGDVKVLDLLLALSLRIRELLLARLQLIRQNDLFSDPSSANIPASERLNEVVEELAEDAAAAMWTFACVKACTGLRSVPLFEACCSILCQDPIDMRKRARSAQYGPGTPMGVDDVVDRLAEAENEDQVQENDGLTTKNKTLDEDVVTDKDAFLDWLSPTEVNDVLWAIALHGSNNTSATDEITLSETASTLREIAFDRLLEWLEFDIELSQNYYDGKATTNQIIQSDNDEKTVEVVDAAALLSSGMESNSISEESIPIENITFPLQKDVQEIEVVDAAALLASSSESSKEMIETETITASSNSLVENSEGDSIGTQCDNETSRSSINDPSPIFTPHDLAIMAWSVTELRDPLQIRIVGKIVSLVEQLGFDGTKHLGGGDLANLAWAISKFSDRDKGKEANGMTSPLGNVLSWIAHNALQRVMKGRSSDHERTKRILESFQPPELARLAWAIANTLSAQSIHSQKLKRNTEVMELVRLSLEASAFNSEQFATEDLLRIAWAFLELCGDNDSWTTLPVVDALGSILASAEHSLHQWERGKMSTTQSEVQDASVFSSFFGKSRLKDHLLEHSLNDGDDDDDDENALAPILEKSRKPLLKDLPVDPATLCRAACGYQRLSRKYPSMKGAWALTRVAIRLLVSKNARLMKECSIHDVIRLCEATVLAEADGHGTDLVIGLFARKVLQVLNAALDNDSDAIDSSIDVSQASHGEICTLIWSLGVFGVKHHFHDDAKRSAYKRMHFVCKSALLSPSAIDTLDTPSLSRLLRGTVLMNYLASDKPFLLNILKATEKKCLHLTSRELCYVVESVALLKDGMSPGHQKDAPKNGSFSDSRQTKEGDSEPQEQSGDSIPETGPFDLEESSRLAPKASIEEELQLSCDAILANVGAAARKDAANFSLKEIRRLLAVFSLLPFQDDALIESLSSEVALRKTHLDLLPRESLGTLLHTARSSAESVKDTALGHTETESVLDQIKNGFKSFFSTMKEAEDNDEDILTEELLKSVQDSIDKTSKASKSADDLQRALGFSLDSIVSTLKRATAFELAQCKELIENYHRINFVTGDFRSRYDKTRARDIAKRVLGRLLP